MILSDSFYAYFYETFDLSIISRPKIALIYSLSHNLWSVQISKL